jgi:RNA polymerase sigma factor (sigma-70 family)
MGMGEATDFDDLFIATRPPLYARVMQLLGDYHEAEEVVQEVYLKLCADKARKTFMSHPNPVAYSVVTATNIIRDNWRRRRRLLKALTLAYLLEPRDDHDGGLPECEDRMAIASILRKLTSSEASAIRLVDIENYSLQEAALLLGVHWGTVHRNRQRGLRQLRVEIDKYLPPAD